MTTYPVEFKDLEEENERLQAKLKIAKADARLWKKRTTEAANAVGEFENLQAENKRLKEEKTVFGCEKGMNHCVCGGDGCDNAEVFMGICVYYNPQALQEKPK